MQLEVRIGADPLILLADRAAYCPQARALLVADVHLGKACSFRALGVPVPGGTTQAGLARLDALLARLRPKSLYVLGDLLHGPAVQQAGAIDQLAEWRSRHADTGIVLVRGNHDRRAGDPPPRCGVDLVNEGHRLGPWVLCHEPRDDDAGHVLAGHLHPAYRLSGRRESVRLPAFWVRERHTVLPAFGEFTGGASLRAAGGDRIYICDGEHVHRIPDVATDRRR